MENCIFCKIIKGEIPSIKVYEDNKFVAFEDLKPANKGHTVIIPKEHSEDILSMNKELGCSTLEVIQKIGTACMKGLDAKGFNIIVNTKPEAGQVIFHTHIHIIPRYENDGIKHWKQYDIPEEERILSAEKIIKALE
ncbi:HIT family protein [Candidatus Woesearchaeota archaeon]|nr:HIT family protein [Candidatus Woesearchaeota archaeon]